VRRALPLILALAACSSSEGELGEVIFTPRECGRPLCDFADAIGVGGLVNVQLTSDGDIPADELDLSSDSEDVLEVRQIADLAGAPAWELRGIEPGSSSLEVRDGDGDLIDKLRIQVHELASIGMQQVLGEDLGDPEERDGYDEAWTLQEREAYSFQVTPLVDSDGTPTMGRYVYDWVLPPAIEAALIDEDPSDGYLYFTTPDGNAPDNETAVEYDVNVELEGDEGLVIYIQFTVPDPDA
jgi:hypothetical protein